MAFETHNYNADINKIERIEFGIFGNNEIKRYSVIKDQFGINIPEAYENNQPKQGGLIDKRLGVTDYNLICDTCGLSPNRCPGHFGHCEMAEEVFHYGYLDIVKSILNCVCLQCSKLLISKNKDEIIEAISSTFGKQRFVKIKKLTSNVKFCSRPETNCGKPVGKIARETTKSGSIFLKVTYPENYNPNQSNDEKDFKKSKFVEILNAKKVYNILKNIDDEDCRLLGLDPSKNNRPENLIIKYFPIAPVAIRPSVKLELLSGPSEDHLTTYYANIVKDNGRLRKQKDLSNITGEESKYNQDYLALLQYDVAIFYGNDSILPKSEQKGGKTLISIADRLRGKYGHIRGNLSGKRVDFCARTVITSDPNLGIDELGVPIKIALNLTFPETVTEYNLDRLTKLVRNGRDVYPGANFVCTNENTEGETKTKIDLRYRKKSVKLHYGYIVERHIVDGDPVLFNRQPTLHKMSMMSHKIKVIKDNTLNTFRLNVNTTTPYNADFDGDEMNLFAPQSIQTQLELANIADVKRQIITPKNSKPIIKLKQDTVIGTYKMTEKEQLLDYHDAMNLAMWTNNMFNVNKKGLSTHELFSLIIPDLINYSDNRVVISNGKLEKGVMGDNILNQKIIYFSWDKHGLDTTRDFFNNSQRLTANWLLLNGFTVGLGDATTKKEILDDVLVYTETKKMEINKMITEMENNPETIDAETFEQNLLSTLVASNGDIIKKVYDHLSKNETHNNFYVMIESKAKGSQNNIGQIIGGLGQNVLENKRIKKKVNNRTLPHFFQNDDRAESRGFIPNSFFHGLNIYEFFFHHMSARDGFIDTAIKTSESGYLQRKLIKGMEDIMVVYDKTVRSGNNVVIQYIYGDNNINQSHYKSVQLKMINMNNSEIEKMFKFSDNSNEDFYNKMIKYRDELRNIQMISNLNYITIQDTYMLPINIERIIYDVIHMDFKYKEKPEKLTSEHILEQINYILSADVTKVVAMRKNDYKDKTTVKYQDQLKSKWLLKVALYEYLAPKRCIEEYKINKNQFDMIVNEIIKSYKKASIEPGEMVGILSAQTLGEILTQMSCHYDEEVIISKGSKIMKIKIGKLIDDIHLSNSYKINYINEHSTEIDIKDENYYICGITENEKVKWNRISHVSRHPTNGKLVKVKLLSGREIITTKSHNFIIRDEQGIKKVEANDLYYGQRISVSRFIEYNHNENINYNIVYITIGKGIALNEITNYDNIIEDIHNNNKDNLRDLLYGFMLKQGTIKLDERVYRDICLLFTYFDIFTYIRNDRIYILRSDYNKFNNTFNRYEEFKESDLTMDDIDIDIIPYIGLNIRNIYKKLYQVVNIDNDVSRKILSSEIIKLMNIKMNVYISEEIKKEINYITDILNNNVIWDKIVDIIEIENDRKYVYDFTVPNNETFMLSNQVIVHNTLNTFHQAGLGVVGMQGVPRIREILSYSKNIQMPIMSIKLKPEYRSDIKIAHKVEAYLRHTLLKDLINKMDIIYDPESENKLKEDGINTNSILYTGNSNIGLDNMPWLYRFEISREALLENDITLLEIKIKFVKYWDDMINESLTTKKKTVLNKVINGAILSNNDNSTNPLIHIRFDINNPDNLSIFEISQFIMNKISVKGVANIQKISKMDKQKVIEYNQDGSINTNANEWVIYTDGIDLDKIKTIKYIDFFKTYMNNVHLVYLSMGIEAARSLIMKEIDNLYNGSGNPINTTHIEMLADIMTNTGSITSIDRHGINRLDTDPLSRASFEKTVEQLITASVFGEVDYMRSVSSRVMAGRVIKGGTGFCDIIMDNDMIEQSEVNDIIIQQGATSIVSIDTNPIIGDIIKRDLDDIFIP
jgi:DNA-directed RNA polymerase II subunit RPB1